MALSRTFKETVCARAQHDPAYRDRMLQEAVQTLVAGDMETAKSLLQLYVNATVGFQELGRAMDMAPQSLTRMLGPDGNPQRRIKAGAAQLAEGEWRMRDVKIWDLTTEGNPEAEATRRDTLAIASDLTQQRIIDGFGRPRYIPVWDLPDFIGELEESGFSARRYAVWFQSELARPVFFAALVLMSAAFTIRHARGANMGLMVLMAVIVGFGLHYLRNFAQILGESGQIPVALAAWAPPVASLLMALGLLLHLEDG